MCFDSQSESGAAQLSASMIANESDDDDDDDDDDDEEEKKDGAVEKEGDDSIETNVNCEVQDADSSSSVNSCKPGKQN